MSKNAYNSIVKCGAFRNEKDMTINYVIVNDERCQGLLSQLDMSKLWLNGIKFSTTCF